MNGPTKHILLAKRFAGFLFLWIVVTGADASALVAGGLAAGAATWLGTLFASPDEPRLRLLRFSTLLPGFFARSIAGGLDVAWRAFHPRPPLKPGWIAYRPNRLRPGTPWIVLGGEISLLPGTLVAGSERGSLLIHCLDTRSTVSRQIEFEEGRLAGAVDDG